MSSFQLSIQFFLQFAVILVACRVVGLIVRRLGQPQVIGEMIAGILLGPSLFGLLAPAWHDALFPTKLAIDGVAVVAHGKAVAHPLMTVMYCVAQLGLACYMFLVGVEFRIDLIRTRMKSAVFVSIAGIVAPFVLGGAVAVAFAGNAAMFKPEVKLWENMLFLGAAMAITAFPVLARIIKERGLTGTSIATLTLAAASSEDAAAWCVLAIVLASFRAEPAIAALAVGGAVVYAGAMLTLGKRLIAQMIETCERVPRLRGLELPAMMILLMLASWYSDYIGLHAVFGAFILGTAVPRGTFADGLRTKLEPFVVNLLLPMFFVYSGMNTKMTLVNTPQLWAIAGLLLVVAVLGKGLACYFAARLAGEPNREAMAIGVLMNARGLTELIILNIGRDIGIITDELFSMMVLMAILTTLMATPLFELVYRRKRAGEPAMPTAAAISRRSTGRHFAR